MKLFRILILKKLIKHPPKDQEIITVTRRFLSHEDIFILNNLLSNYDMKISEVNLEYFLVSRISNKEI